MKANPRTILFLAGMALLVSNACAWSHTDVTVGEAHALIDSMDDLTVVDVREPSEYCDARGHIPGARNYPWNSAVLQARYEELPVDVPVMVVCRSGARSNAAANFLDSKGFSTVYDMLGGMSAWAWETAPCKYSGGSGTVDDPYRIATAVDLITLGETPDDYDKRFILTADIDLDPNLPHVPTFFLFGKAVIAPDTNDADRGFQGTAFTGIFDGDGHTISHLTITGESYLGLFGNVDSGGTISNLGLDAVDITGSGDYVGGLVGYNTGSITTTHSTGTVTGDQFVGGLVGSSWNIIVASYSTGRITGNEKVGGLVGYNDGTITSSFSTGAPSGSKDVGGLAGRNGGCVVQCYSSGAVSCPGANAGGLVGSEWLVTQVHEGRCCGVVRNSFWDVESSDQSSSAGGTGRTTAEMQDVDTFLSDGWDFAGEVLNGTCDYWQISPGGYPRLRYHAGDSPVMPEGSGTLQKPYLIRDARDLGTMWFRPMAHYRLAASVDLSGITWSVAIVPWFEGTFDGDSCVISSLRIRGRSSYLGLFGKVGTDGKISDLGLEEIDIDGVGNYVGGLVGYNDGTITASYSTGAVSGGGGVGGLAGYNDGTITTSCSTAAVSGDSGAGGLVGVNWAGSIATSYSISTVTGGGVVGGLVGSNWASVAASCSVATVSGDRHVGGLVGTNWDSIACCYSIGSVTGDRSVGGFVGRNYGNSYIATSYTACAVNGRDGVGGLVGWSTYPISSQGTVTDSFWDTETSGQAESFGGIGKTTAEMMGAETYLDAGWDFIGETENGTEDIWRILEGQDYPRLWWEAALE